MFLPGLAAHAENWPSFRGTGAGGVGHGRTPTTWDVARSTDVAWKTPIPGLAFSSPIIWDDRVYVTTAVPMGAQRGTNFRTRHVWKLLSLDRASGKVIWEQTAHDGVPHMQRHVHSSYANATPATDGQYIVALFGTEAFACFDKTGRLIWKKLLQVDSNPDAFNSGSSPVIVQGMAVLQDDRDRGSYIAAYRLSDGQEVWRANREDGASQSTPVVWTAKDGRSLLIAVAERSVTGLDVRTGRTVWRFAAAKTDIAYASPVLAGDVLISSAASQLRAFRADGAANTARRSESTNGPGILWSTAGGGGTVSTPLILGNHVFVLGNGGGMTVYDVPSGRQISQRRAGTGEFCASAVSADGKIYVFNREGEATVLRAEPGLDVIARNSVGEPIMASPAVADGTLYVRTSGHLIALRQAA
jgi:outer membrane protein assembly factor BamB